MSLSYILEHSSVFQLFSLIYILYSSMYYRSEAILEESEGKAGCQLSL